MTRSVTGATGGLGPEGVVALTRARLACSEPVLQAECSGFLLSSRIVVTAAHCVEDREAWSLDVVVGADVNEGRAVSVAGVRLHPDWDKALRVNDIAVLLLAAEVAEVAPLSLGSAAIPSEVLTIVGFGQSAQDVFDGTMKRTGTVSVEATASATFDVIPGPNMACGGDSGGPLIRETPGVEPTVVGIVSFGDGLCTTRTTATALAAHGGFIDQARTELEAEIGARPQVASDLDMCLATCASDTDCPLGTYCGVDDQSVCRLGNFPAGKLGAACSGPDTCPCELCVPMPDSADGCRCLEPCDAQPCAEDDTGCSGTGRRSALPLWWVVALLLAFGACGERRAPPPTPASGDPSIALQRLSTAIETQDCKLFEAAAGGVLGRQFAETGCAKSLEEFEHGGFKLHKIVEVKTDGRNPKARIVRASVSAKGKRRVILVRIEDVAGEWKVTEL